jgi:hypothetical protein
MLPIKISHVLISSPIVHPAPLWVADKYALPEWSTSFFIGVFARFY